MKKEKVRVFNANKNFKSNEAVKYFDKNGFIILRGLYKNTDVEELSKKFLDIFRKPAAGGCFGYSKKDHYRKYIFPPLVVEKKVCEMILNKKLISLVEAYIECEPVMCELHIKRDDPVPNVYFPLHLDMHAGWNQGEVNNFKLNKKTPLSKNSMKYKLGVGCLIYIDDVSKDCGNFMYSKGSHKNLYMKGGKFSDYNVPERKKILENIVHLDGLRGDVILFDDRGWHGPNQPSKKPRMVIEIDFTNTKIFGRWQKHDLQVPISYMSFLTEKQLRLLGKGAHVLYTTNSMKDNYKILGFNKSPLYNFVSLLIKNGFVIQYYKDLIKHYVAKIFNRSYEGRFKKYQS